MRILLAAAAIGYPMMAACQTADSDGDFQLKVIEVSAETGDAAIPASCSGLFRAFALTSDPESPSTAQFRTMEDDAAFVAMLAYKDEMGSDNQGTIDAISAQVSRVSAVYIEWFSFNIETNDELISETIRDNFVFCNERLTEWREAMGE